MWACPSVVSGDGDVIMRRCALGQGTCLDVQSNLYIGKIRSQHNDLFVMRINNLTRDRGIDQCLSNGQLNVQQGSQLKGRSDVNDSTFTSVDHQFCAACIYRNNGLEGAKSGRDGGRANEVVVKEFDTTVQIRVLSDHEGVPHVGLSAASFNSEKNHRKSVKSQKSHLRFMWSTEGVNLRYPICLTDAVSPWTEPCVKR